MKITDPGLHASIKTALNAAPPATNSGMSSRRRPIDVIAIDLR
jgi:hypothetical protein